jgi:hypothetical protein
MVSGLHEQPSGLTCSTHTWSMRRPSSWIRWRKLNSCARDNSSGWGARLILPFFSQVSGTDSAAHHSALYLSVRSDSSRNEIAFWIIHNQALNYSPKKALNYLASNTLLSKYICVWFQNKQVSNDLKRTIQMSKSTNYQRTDIREIVQ